ncbi:MAG: GspH/FimT family protein [Ectothiorhodospiraceae bacterium]
MGANGFSLLELVLVLLIVGAIGAVAAPRWSGWTADLTGAADTLAADLRYGQARAMNRATHYRLRFAGDGYVLEACDSGDDACDPGADDWLARRFADGEAQRSLGRVACSSCADVRFEYPSGAPSDGASLTLSADGESETVTVTTESGYVRR